MNNPTVDILQKRLAALEGGESALATASGMHGVFALTTHLGQGWGRGGDQPYDLR